MRQTKTYRTLNIILIILSVLALMAFAVAGVWLVLQLMASGLVSSHYIYGAAGILIVLAVLTGLWLFLPHRNIWRILALVFCCGLTALCLVGFDYVVQTEKMLESISLSRAQDAYEKSEEKARNDEISSIVDSADNLNGKLGVTLATLSLKNSGHDSIQSLNGGIIGTTRFVDEEGTDKAVKQLEDKGISFQTVDYPSAFALADALFAGQVDAIVFPESQHIYLQEAATAQNRYLSLTIDTNTLDRFIYYVPVPEEMKNDPDKVANITEDPFTILISGNDNYGSLGSLSRSDVNMLVTVNPRTKQVLMVSIPRDTYAAISCKKNLNACAASAGQKDKLTHTGIFGVGTTESTIEDLLGVEINYTVQVNFSSLINIVDALGGIDVNVEEGQEVETFYANGTEGVHAGKNHLDGNRALAFARERHAYVDDDNQRIRNQQIVLQAILKEVMSPSMLFKYPELLKALSTAFYTNMPSSQIKELIRFELSGFPSWTIDSFTLTGAGVTGYSPNLNANASMALVSQDQLDFARELIEDVKEGISINPDDHPEFGDPDFSQVYVLPDPVQLPETDEKKDEKDSGSGEDLSDPAESEKPQTPDQPVSPDQQQIDDSSNVTDLPIQTQ